jgi:hypothetical protein
MDGETNESEPLTTHRNQLRRHQNRERPLLPGSAWREACLLATLCPAYRRRDSNLGSGTETFSAGNRPAAFVVAGAGNVIMAAGLRPTAKAVWKPPEPTERAPILDPTTRT